MNSRFKSLLSLVLTFALILATGCNQDEKENEKERKRIYAETERTNLLLGLWVPPVTTLTPTQADANKRYAEVAESGINMAYTHHCETYDMDQLLRALNAAEKNGIKMMVSLPSGNDEAILDLVNLTKDHPAVLGYNMGDEPAGAQFEALANLKIEIEKIVSEDKIIMCNMLPNYANPAVYGTKPDKEFDAYEKFLDLYMQTVKPDVLSFDHYPFMADRNHDVGRITLMLENLCDIRNCGEKYNVPTWGFVQNGSWAGTRIPNDNELRFVCNLHLIFGLKSYSYFLYCSPSDVSGAEGIYNGMLTYSGGRTKVYDRVKKQNKELNAMKGVFLNYNHKGFVFHNMDYIYEDAMYETEKYESYNELASIESNGNILVGCFDKDGKTGLYVMNFNYTKSTAVKLNLAQANNYRVWGAKGLEQLDNGETISISLKPGEARFIEIVP